MSRCNFVVPRPIIPSSDAYALYIFGPRSGVTRSSENRDARFINPFRRVNAGKGNAFSKSVNNSGNISAKSSAGGQSYRQLNFREKYTLSFKGHFGFVERNSSKNFPTVLGSILSVLQSTRRHRTLP